MLIIRQEQLEALSRSREKDFEARAVSTLVQLSEKLKRVEDRKALKDFVQEGIIESRTCNIIKELDVIRYLKLKYQIGLLDWNAPRLEWIQNYLRKKWSAEKKLDHIIERLRFGEEQGGTL